MRTSSSGARTSRLVVLALLCPSLIGSASAEEADPSEPRRAAARALLQEGNLLHDQADYSAALERYRRAHALYPTYKIEFNIGLTLQAMGRAGEAAGRFDAFLRWATREGETSPMVKAARIRLAALRRALARLAVVGVAGSRVALDGHPVGTIPLGGVLYLQPGEHRLEVQEPSSRMPHLRLVTLRAGEELEIRVPAMPLAGARVSPGAGPEPARVRAAPFYKRWWFWTAVGLVVAGGVVGGAMAARRGDGRLPVGELGIIE